VEGRSRQLMRQKEKEGQKHRPYSVTRIPRGPYNSRNLGEENNGFAHGSNAGVIASGGDFFSLVMGRCL